MALVRSLPSSLTLVAGSLVAALSMACVKVGAGPAATGGATGTGSSGRANTGGSVGSGGVVGTGGVTASGGSGTGGVGTGGISSSGGASDTGGATGSGGTSPIDAGASDRICQMAQVNWAPKIPTVYLLVDRSGSMFHCLTGDTGSAVCAQPANTAWTNLKEAVRSVVRMLDSQVRFGFATIWGTDPAQQGMCPSIQGMTTDNVAPAMGNAAAIMTKYDSLMFPPNSTQQGMKFESPASESIQVVSAALTAMTVPGDKYMIFITDGQPDYCDDSNGLCAPDSVVGRIQAAKTAGITTIVLGIQTALFDLPAGILQAFANAGAGEATVAPLRMGASDAFAFHDQCNNLAPWHADLLALGKTDERGSTVGTYSPTAGPTRPYMPSAADQTQLVTQLAAALAGVKSCTFDLGDVDGKAIKVDLTPASLANAHVLIMGTEVPQNDTSGWRMNSATQLELMGAACTTWRMPNVTMINFQFPCGTIIFE